MKVLDPVLSFSEVTCVLSLYWTFPVRKDENLPHSDWLITSWTELWLAYFSKFPISFLYLSVYSGNSICCWNTAILIISLELKIFILFIIIYTGCHKNVIYVIDNHSAWCSSKAKIATLLSPYFMLIPLIQVGKLQLFFEFYPHLTIIAKLLKSTILKWFVFH